MHSHIRAVVFDLYGTLLDIDSLNDIAKEYTPQHEQFVEDWRNRQLAIAFTMASSKRYANFDIVTERALDEIAPRYYIRLAGDVKSKLMAGWRQAPFYDDVIETLTVLASYRIETAVLTNGTMVSATAALRNGEVLPLVDVIFSADAARTYKPHRAMYALATTHFECAPEELIFVSSHDWDASGAAQFGMISVFCQRRAPVVEGPRRERLILTLKDVLPIAGVEI